MTPEPATPSVRTNPTEAGIAEQVALVEAGRPGARKRAVGMVVVHGMGSQKGSETLLEWAEPLLRRMEWLAEDRPATAEINRLVGAKAGRVEPPVGVQRAMEFHAVELADDDKDEVVAHLRYLDASNAPVELQVRITEARWAEAFLGMRRGEVFTWGAGFIWRTVARLGSHFTRTIWLAIWRVLDFFGMQRSPRQPLLFVLGIISLILVFVVFCAPLIVGLWSLLIGVAVVTTVLLPVLGLILFFPVFKDALESAIDGLVEFVGDVATWTRRPVRAAAMRQVVRTQVSGARTWLRGKDRVGFERSLVVVAHSQGAAISAEVLFDSGSGEGEVDVDAFVSVGAAITLLGSSRWRGTFRAARKMVAGVGIQQPVFDPVANWAADPKKTTWYNMWGIWDPFAAGPISTDTRKRAARWRLSYRTRAEGVSMKPVAPTTEAAVPAVPNALGPREYPVHNSSSPLTDHQSYAPNVVQVIDPIARLVMDVEVPIEPAEAENSELARRELRRARLHVRATRELGVQRILVLLLAASMFLVPVGAAVGSWFSTSLLWLFGNPKDGPVVWLAGFSWFGVLVVAVAVASVGFWLNIRLWRWYIGKIAWRHEPRRGIWVVGGIYRLGLLVALLVVFVLSGLGAVYVWDVPLIVLGAGLSALVFVVPWISLLPLPVEASRG